jgi:hypothetical protein
MTEQIEWSSSKGFTELSDERRQQLGESVLVSTSPPTPTLHRVRVAKVGLCCCGVQLHGQTEATTVREARAEHGTVQWCNDTSCFGGAP